MISGVLSLLLAYSFGNIVSKSLANTAAFDLTGLNRISQQQTHYNEEKWITSSDSHDEGRYEGLWDSLPSIQFVGSKRSPCSLLNDIYVESRMINIPRFLLLPDSRSSLLISVWIQQPSPSHPLNYTLLSTVSQISTTADHSHEGFTSVIHKHILDSQQLSSLRMGSDIFRLRITARILRDNDQHFLNDPQFLSSLHYDSDFFCKSALSNWKYTDSHQMSSTSTSNMTSMVSDSAELALLNQSKLSNNELLRWHDDTSSILLRHFLNNLVSGDGIYLFQVGVGNGSCLAAILQGNKVARSLSIDNWSLSTSGDEDLQRIIEKLDSYVASPLAHMILNKPFWEVESGEILSSLDGHRPNIFYFDHTNDMDGNIFQDVLATIFQFIPSFDENFIMVINHWNDFDTRRGTEFSIKFLTENRDCVLVSHLEVQSSDSTDFAVFVMSRSGAATSILSTNDGRDTTNDISNSILLPKSYAGLIPHLCAHTPLRDQPFPPGDGSVWLSFQVKNVPKQWIRNQMISLSIWTAPLAGSEAEGSDYYALFDHITDFSRVLFATSHPGLAEIDLSKLVGHQSVDLKVRFVVHVKSDRSTSNSQNKLEPNSNIPGFVADIVLRFGHSWPHVSMSHSNTLEPTTTEQTYIQKIKASLELAFLNHSKLRNQELEGNEGFSGWQYRHFINNYASLNDIVYLEVGVFLGSTLVSTVFGNDILASLAVDSWDDANVLPLANGQIENVRTKFQRKIQSYQQYVREFHVLERNCWDVSGNHVQSILGYRRVNLYLFDGPHEFHDHFLAVVQYLSAMDDSFVFIVDDWNFVKIRQGTFAGLAFGGIEIIFQLELFTENNPGLSSSMWHNGYGIFVCRKQHRD